jgi:hypothetical protein
MRNRGVVPSLAPTCDTSPLAAILNSYATASKIGVLAEARS